MILWFHGEQDSFRLKTECPQGGQWLTELGRAVLFVDTSNEAYFLSTAAKEPNLLLNLSFDPSRIYSSDNTNCPLSPGPDNSPTLLTFENIYVRMQRPTRAKNSEQYHVLYPKITENLWQLIWDLKVCMCSAGLLLQSLKCRECELILQLVFEFQIFAFVFSLQLFQCLKEPCMVLK